MRVMGLRTLFVVRPRFPAICSHPDAIAFASGATDVLAAATEVDTLDDALAGVHCAIAVSAESREFSAAPRPPWEVCPELAADLAADPDRQVALVTFANFTTAAQTKNIEVGALVRDPGFAEALCARFEGLLREGALRRLAAPG